MTSCVDDSSQSPSFTVNVTLYVPKFAYVVVTEGPPEAMLPLPKSHEYK